MAATEPMGLPTNTRYQADYDAAKIGEVNEKCEGPLLFLHAEGKSEPRMSRVRPEARCLTETWPPQDTQSPLSRSCTVRLFCSPDP